MTDVRDPTRLLRDPEPVEPYPAEPSDEAVAAALGLDRAEVARFDMNTMPLTEWAEYGDQSYLRLREALGRLAGVKPSRIVPGAGADELIRLVTTQAVGPGDAVVIPTPTFAMFAVETRIAGARPVTVARADPATRQSAAHLRRVVEDEGARLVWICSPNNPTGDRYEVAEIEELATGLDALVVVDEVYLEFAEETLGAAGNSLSAASLQERLPHVAVLRSLSKAYGMAAARIGYLVLSESLAARFDAVRLPLAIAGPSEALALATLERADEARAMRLAVIEQRRRLSATLERLGCDVLPSVANFVIFRPREPEPLADALDARGLILRRYESGLLTGWLRATARPAAETDRLIAALEDLLGGADPAHGGSA